MLSLHKWGASRAGEESTLEKPLSAKDLARQAEDLWCEVGKARFTDEWKDAFSHIVSVYQLTDAVRILLDRTNLTPKAMLSAYWSVRCALDGLGFISQKEQEIQEADEERVADAQFLKGAFGDSYAPCCFC